MSNTRYADPDSPLAYNRWMSSPQFTALRPVPANLVLPKAMLYRDKKAREMAFFIQGMSMQPGGLTAFAEQLVGQFPERCRQDWSSLRTFAASLNQTPAVPLPTQTVAPLGEFLAEVILNPEIDLSRIEAPCFDDLGTALAEIKRRYEDNAMRDFVMTEAGKLVMETLGQAILMSRLVVVEGNAGAGKTTNARAWCAARPGLVRYVSLSGITNRITFFQKIGAAIGLATCQRKAHQLQAKIEDFFARSKLMLVLDEAHYLFPQTARVRSSPELVDWLNTSLINQGVPVALLCTDQLARLRNRAERQVGWNSDQFRHRVFRYRKLEGKTPLADVQAVTRNLLSCTWDDSLERWRPTTRACSEIAVEALAGYAHTQSIPLAVAASCIDEARLNARQAGRVVVTLADFNSALNGGQIPSDAALVRAFNPVSAERRARTAGVTNKSASKAYVSISQEAGESAFTRQMSPNKSPAPALA